MIRITAKALSVFCSVMLAWTCIGSGLAEAASPVSFTAQRIGSFRSEACGVADFNGDGQLDVVAGPYTRVILEVQPD